MREAASLWLKPTSVAICTNAAAQGASTPQEMGPEGWECAAGGEVCPPVACVTSIPGCSSLHGLETVNTDLALVC